MNKKVLKAAFAASLPVLMGYTAMGAAAGILLASAVKFPFVPFWAFLTSAVNISGALQFIMVEWMLKQTAIMDVILLTFCLNIRYAMYGLSLLERFRGIPLMQKLYLIWTLTDETYALEVECKVPAGGNPVNYCLAVAAFDHLYWITGVTLGALIGRLLPFSNKGIDFAMTALFLVVLTDQCREKQNRLPALIGIAAAVAGRIFFSVNNMLIPAMIIMIVTFIIMRGKLEKGAANE
jgi:4-azaleucine resistance transporter AzlC